MDKTKIKDNIKIPDNLDEYILKGIDEAEKINTLKNKNIKPLNKLKIASIICMLSLGTVTTAYAIDKIIEYFEVKKDSIYQHEKDDFLTYSKNINLSKKDNGIEFKINTLAVDDGFFNMTYTITSNKKIADIDKSYNLEFVANPTIKIIKDGKQVNFNDSGRFDYTEATFESECILKGILRKPITETEITAGTNLTVKLDNIFGKIGNWNIDIKLDNNLISNKSQKYIINKTKDIIKPEQYDYDTKNEKSKYKDVKVSYSIDNIVLSPFGSLITTTEKTNDLIYNKPANIGDMFVLRDDKGNYLDVIHNIGNFPSIVNKPVTNTYEFIRKSDNIKSLTLIPFIYEESPSGFSELIDINNLPATIEVSKYGKIMLKDFKVTNSEIIYTYKKFGAIPSNLDLSFYDKEGNLLLIGGMTEDFINRKDSTHTMRHNLNQDKYKKMAKEIKYISMRKDNNLKLLEDQSIEFIIK